MERSAYMAGRRHAEMDRVSLDSSSVNAWDDLEDQVRGQREGYARRLDDLDPRYDREWNGLPPERRR